MFSNARIPPSNVNVPLGTLDPGLVLRALKAAYPEIVWAGLAVDKTIQLSNIDGSTFISYWDATLIGAPVPSQKQLLDIVAAHPHSVAA